MKHSEDLKFVLKTPVPVTVFFDPLTGDRIGIGFSTYVLTYVAST
jgi:hypothetical protein